MNHWEGDWLNGIETTLRSPVGDLVFRREASGRLLGIRFGERVYLAQRGGWSVWDGGFARWREQRTPNGVIRTVEAAAGATWTERYLWDEGDRLVHADGVDIRRDGEGRVVACHAGGEDPVPDWHRWFYHYGKGGLTAVETPAGSRVISVGPDGRPVAWAGIDRGQCHYDADGHRRAPALPQRLLRDAGGRVWGELDAAGALIATYLWDGHRCLARIDGPPGAPLAAVFCLDPSGTPVRAIYRDRVQRLPRDAYGEGLLAHAGVPGLFGGHQADGLVNLPWRTLDPRLGAFTAPDPFDGGVADPRRGPDTQFAGPLTVEAGAPSPYAVARHDPVGRTDPTGAISGLLLLSDFTWSWQNNLLTFFGLDWWFNLFFSLFTGFQLGRFGSSEGLSASDRLGAFAVRRDGFMTWISDDQGGTPAFATQHIIWAHAERFAEMERGWVIDPQGEFRPTLYGTLLRAAPADQPPFLLRGMREPGNGIAASRNWSRQGGRAAFAAPNLPLPIFPSGGFHLDGDPLPYSGNRDCPLTEMEPAGGLALGTFQQRAVLVLPFAATAPAVGDLALLSDADGDLVLTPVVTSTPRGLQRLIRLEDDAPAIGPLNVTLDTIDPAPASTEALGAAPAAAPANALSAVGTANTYAPGDLLRLTASGGERTVARVARLEARLPLNAALPAGLAGPIRLTRMRAAAIGPNATVASGTTLDFAGATPPVAGTLGVVVTAAGANPAPVRIQNADNPAAVVLDADIAASHAVGAAVQFRPASVQAEIGQRADAAEAGAQVTYTPLSAGGAPDGAASQVLLRASSGSTEVLRLVPAAPVFDAIVLDRPLAGAAPWTVDRLRRKAGTAPIPGLTLDRALAFTSPDANRLDGADALRLLRVTSTAAGAATPLAGPVQVANLTVTPAAGGEPAFATSSSPGTLRDDPRPGQPVILHQGTNASLAVVSALRLSVRLDRAIPGLGARNLGCVALVGDGPVYTAERLDANQLALNPEVRLASGLPAAADFPRFRAGEVVQVVAAGGNTLFRIEGVRGGRLDLDGNAAIPGAAGDVLTVQRMLPSNPSNGHWLIGRNGIRETPGGRLRFDVTSANAFPTGAAVGVIDGNRTWPARVDAAAQEVQVVFAADPGLPAAAVVELHGLVVVASEDTAVFTREDQALLATVGMAAPAAGATEVALAQAFVASDRVAGSARLNPGTLLVPNDEDHSVDRRQAFVDHELAHTIQYAQWGPLWFCYFPMLLLELPVELATDVELPDYGPFVTGRVEANETRWHLIVQDRATLAAQDNDTLQIVQGATTRRVKVVSSDAERIVVRLDEGGAVAPPTGNVHVRRVQDEKVWGAVHSIFQLFTHGGLLNITSGTTWSGIIWLLAKGIYGIYRAIKGTGELFPAVVENNGMHVRPTSEAGRLALASSGRVTIKQGANVLVRQADVSDGVLVVTPPVAFQDQVQVGPYDTHDPNSTFDWLDYYPGTVADLANRFAVTVPGNGNRFSALDRVEVKYQAQSMRTEVMAVAGDTVQLQDPIPVNGAEDSIRIAKVGENEATGNWDSAAMTEMGMGWMKWLFDPWGQFDRSVDFSNEYVNLIPRVARYLFGTQMYSLLPALGYVFYGRFFVAEHLAKIEQLASSESGELYTPLARIAGQAAATDDYASYRMLVGDIARYRFWTNRTTRSLSDRTRQMEPGVFPANADLRTLVFRVDTGAAGEPNGTTESGPGPGATPARAAADLFAAKPPGDPLQLDAALAAPAGIAYSALAQVPERATVVRHRSVYMAFTQPGQHRLTTANGIDSADESQDAREVQERERQTIFFNIEALDVTVSVGGQTVADGGTVDLVAMQRAAVEVTVPAGAPSGPRRWRLTVRRPEQGDRLRQPADLELQARATVGAVAPVELSRFYAWNAADNSYADGGLAKFGLHLGGDVDIPVRRFQVRVLDILPLRATADAAAAAAADLTQGAEGFLLVPSPVVSPPMVASFDGRAFAPAPGGDPVFTVENVTPIPEAARPLVGAEGRVYRIRFAAAPALAANVAVRVDVTVGEATGTQATLHCDFNLATA
jgi:large repetitive protein